jgi:DNA-binding MarR family transcriptional regulator
LRRGIGPGVERFMANMATHPFADKLGGAPHSKESLRLWLRLLSCSIIIEKRIRVRLDEDFDTTLPRFDVLAALERHADGLTMTELSESLMVSNGNVTGVVTRLIEDGLLSRTVDAADRRSASVRLTRKGRDSFLKTASVHEQWIDEMFADLTDSQVADLMKLLTMLRRSIEKHPI